MGKLSINMDGRDLEELRKRAEDLRIPPTVYARTLNIHGMRAEAKRSD